MSKGFSLIEAVVSLFILAGLIYIASVSLLDLAPKYRLESAVWKVNTALNHARYKSIFNGVSVRTKFSSAGYEFEKYDDAQKEWKRDEWHLLEGVRIEANNCPIFHPEGTVSNMASIMVSNAWGRYKISLAISGRIKITRLN
ncbi:MAG: hypothetical protein WCC06_08395 [Candidatus Aminicenantales bacterium]